MTITVPSIRFVDLARQQARIRQEIDAAISRTLKHGLYIMGPEIGELETALADYCGTRHAIVCSSGADALTLVLMSQNVGPGQAIFCPAFTFVATASPVALLGASVFFVDVREDSFNIDPASLENAIEEAKAMGLRPAGVIPVDLFGLPADHDAIAAIAAREGLFILDDAAQGFGGVHHGRRLGSIGHAAATSFFPAKPLGCYGDGGAVFTDDDELAETVRSLLFHGKGKTQYDNIRVGMTGRMDSLQAGILIEKLKIFDDERQARERIATRYTQALGDAYVTPDVPQGLESAWAQYTIKPKAASRDRVVAALKERGVPTAIYYPMPLNQQTAYRHHPIPKAGLPVAERLCKNVFSLPMHPYLDEGTQDYIITALQDAA